MRAYSAAKGGWEEVNTSGGVLLCRNKMNTSSNEYPREKYGKEEGERRAKGGGDVKVHRCGDFYKGDQGGQTGED